MFTKHRFSHLLRFFHLVNNEGLPGPGEPDYIPCARYQPFLYHANKIFRHHYTPHQEISGDEINMPYNKFMGSINSSDVMLYTYWDERQTVHYWKKVSFNIIARMMLNSYILYKENYRGPGKLKSRYNCSESIIEKLGEEWLMLKDSAGAGDPWDHEDSENSLKRKSPNALSAAQRRGGKTP
jgi:hypothetical protein